MIDFLNKNVIFIGALAGLLPLIGIMLSLINLISVNSSILLSKSITTFEYIDLKAVNYQLDIVQNQISDIKLILICIFTLSIILYILQYKLINSSNKH